MSILKSNSASSLDDPITADWLDTTTIHKEFIPDKMIKSGRIKTYCELRNRPKRSYPTDIYFSIFQAFVMNTSARYQWGSEPEEFVINTKAIWHHDGQCMMFRDLKTKRDVLQFIDDVNEILSDL